MWKLSIPTDGSTPPRLHASARSTVQFSPHSDSPSALAGFSDFIHLSNLIINQYSLLILETCCNLDFAYKILVVLTVRVADVAVGSSKLDGYRFRTLIQPRLTEPLSIEYTGSISPSCLWTKDGA
jgi:hypothetical protein